MQNGATGLWVIGGLWADARPTGFHGRHASLPLLTRLWLPLRHAYGFRNATPYGLPFLATATTALRFTLRAFGLL